MNIGEKFSQAARLYHEKALLQKEAASCFYRRLSKEQLDELPSGEVLEIGCGTGFLTEHLFKLFPGRRFLITDLASGMLDFCKSRLQNPFASYRLLNGEEPLSCSPSVIASTLTLQWFRSPIKTLQSYFKLLPEKGLLAISFLDDKSFPEWRRAAEKAGVPYTAYPLPSYQECLSELQGLSRLSLQREEIRLPCSSLRAFFSELKAIGASHSKSSRLAPSQVQGLLNFWEEESMTYSITTVIARKFSE